MPKTLQQPRNKQIKRVKTLRSFYYPNKRKKKKRI